MLQRVKATVRPIGPSASDWAEAPSASKLGTPLSRTSQQLRGHKSRLAASYNALGHAR